jgi:hypothetical protein
VLPTASAPASAPLGAGVLPLDRLLVHHGSSGF